MNWPLERLLISKRSLTWQRQQRSETDFCCWNFRDYSRINWCNGLGGDWWSKGCGFKSQRHILDGNFSHLFVVKNVMFVWMYKNKWKRGRGRPIKIFCWMILYLGPNRYLLTCIYDTLFGSTQIFCNMQLRGQHTL